MSARRVFAVLLAVAAAAAHAQTPEPWPAELVDPAPVEGRGEPADLILPLPCGGGMAFQRVDVPTDIANPIADRPFRMGQSDAATGFSDYLRPTYLRGPFVDSELGVTYFYIARYEMTEAQLRALRGECDAPFGMRDRFAAGGVSWFEAVDILRRLTEWVLANERDAMPAQGDRLGFLRLPTEAEWEFATRGGVRADPASFLARRFFQDGALGEYAHFQAPGQGRGKLRPVGLRAPNPLGLFDVYGNAEELMLEPYRLNAVGRAHGQTGGLVTRGGSIVSEEGQIYTAQRLEYPMFAALTGAALVGDFFGIRPVIGAHVVTDAAFDAIRETWIGEAQGGTGGDTDPLAALGEMLESELDPRRKEALTALQLELRVASEEIDESLAQAAKSTLLSGAAFVKLLNEDTAEVSQLYTRALNFKDLAANALGEQRSQLLQQWGLTNERMAALRNGIRTYLLSYRSALETLTSDVDDAQAGAAFDTLRSDLEGAGQAELAELVDRFWVDVGRYGESPDMDVNALLQLALD